MEGRDNRGRRGSADTRKAVLLEPTPPLLGQLLYSLHQRVARVRHGPPGYSHTLELRHTRDAGIDLICFDCFRYWFIFQLFTVQQAHAKGELSVAYI